MAIFLFSGKLARKILSCGSFNGNLVKIFIVNYLYDIIKIRIRVPASVKVSNIFCS